MKYLLYIVAFLSMTMAAQTPVKRETSIPARKVDANPVTPPVGTATAPYLKSDGEWYFKENDGSESRVNDSNTITVRTVNDALSLTELKANDYVLIAELKGRGVYRVVDNTNPSFNIAPYGYLLDNGTQTIISETDYKGLDDGGVVNGFGLNYITSWFDANNTNYVIESPTVSAITTSVWAQRPGRTYTLTLTDPDNNFLEEGEASTKTLTLNPSDKVELSRNGANRIIVKRYPNFVESTPVAAATLANFNSTDPNFNTQLGYTPSLLTDWAQSLGVQRVFNVNTPFDFRALGYPTKTAIFVRNIDKANGINITFGAGGSHNIVGTNADGSSITGTDFFNIQPSEFVVIEDDEDGVTVRASIMPAERVKSFNTYANANAFGTLPYDGLVLIRDTQEVWARKTNTNTAIFPADGLENTDWGIFGGSSSVTVAYPGNNGVPLVNKDNVYYLDETLGAMPTAETEQEISISIVQANSTDTQVIKDAAKAKVTHYRSFDTGAGFIWIESEGQTGSSSVLSFGSFHGKFSSGGDFTSTETPSSSAIDKQSDNQTFRLQGGYEYVVSGYFTKADHATYVNIIAREDGVNVANAGIGGGTHWVGGNSFVHRVSIPEGETKDYTFFVQVSGSPSNLSGAFDIEARSPATSDYVLKSDVVEVGNRQATESIITSTGGTSANSQSPFFFATSTLVLKNSGKHSFRVLPHQTTVALENGTKIGGTFTITNSSNSVVGTLTFTARNWVANYTNLPYPGSQTLFIDLPAGTYTLDFTGAAGSGSGNRTSGNGYVQVITKYEDSKTVSRIAETDFIVDATGATDGDNAVFTDDGAGGLKLTKGTTPQVFTWTGGSDGGAAFLGPDGTTATDVAGWRFNMQGGAGERQIGISNVSNRRRVFTSKGFARSAGSALFSTPPNIKSEALDAGENTTLNFQDYSFANVGDVEYSIVEVWEFAAGSDGNTLLAPVKIHEFKISARVGGSYNGNQFRVELTTY